MDAVATIKAPVEARVQRKCLDSSLVLCVSLFCCRFFGGGDSGDGGDGGDGGGFEGEEEEQRCCESGLVRWHGNKLRFFFSKVRVQVLPRSLRNDHMVDKPCDFGEV